MDTLEKIRRDCGSPDWDSYDAMPVEECTIAHAQKFLDALPEKLRRVDIFPLSDGHIDFEWCKASTEVITAEIDRDGHVVVCPLFEEHPHVHTEFDFTGEIPANVLEMIRAVVSAPKENPIG